jgi:GntR family transcriptional regulator of vanillate catabolism
MPAQPGCPEDGGDNINPLRDSAIQRAAALSSPNPILPPESQTPVATQTAKTILNLRQMLFRGDFRPGEKLSELPLVARLGVSRTPLRLALDRLSHEGLLEPSPSGGFVVREFTLTDIWDAIELRGVLEGTGARLAAERLTELAQLDKVRLYRDQMESYRENNTRVDARFPEYLELNDAFHSAVVDLAQSPILRMSLDRVLALPFAGPSALVLDGQRPANSADLMSISLEHHRALVEAIEKRQGSRAESLAREHSQVSRRSFEIALQHQRAWNNLPGASLIKWPGTA